jgi:myelin regulatory factor
MIEADKGFAYSSFDDAFICQKKNHFQITTHTYVNKTPKYFKINNQFFEISSFKLNLYGIKQESQMQQIAIKESDKDRKLFDYKPYECELNANQMNKLTLRRLHFSQTTNNNNRKKNKPNPDQRYFLLVVEMQIVDTYGQAHTLYSAVSEKLIVRAVNPGQYNNNNNLNTNNSQEIVVEDEEKHDKSLAQWTCSTDANEDNKTCFYGNVGINTSNPDQALSINGNIRLNGFLLQPSDKRVKTNIIPKNTIESLEKIRHLRLYNYDHVNEFYNITGIKSDTGVLADELQQVIPEAVKDTGNLRLSDEDQIENFLNVDKSRIFMECVGAVQELDKKTDNLDIRIDKLEKVVDDTDETCTLDDRSSQQNLLSTKRRLRIGPIDCSWMVNKNEFKKNLNSILVSFGLFSFVLFIAVILTIQMLHLQKQSENELR